MDLHTIEAGLSVYEQDSRLLDEVQLTPRRAALEYITFAESFAQMNGRRFSMASLHERLVTLKTRLTAIDAALFARLRGGIQAKQFNARALRLEFERYTNYAVEKQAGIYVGPDGLDALLDGVLGLRSEFVGKVAADPEMVHYEPTPARVALDLIDNVERQAGDVFYDLGSGLGRMAILFHLLTGLPSRGVELDPLLADSARRLATDLNLPDVSFVAADAREADYAHGNLFFMFTPFMGRVLQAVLDRLKLESQARPITVCTYGACSQLTAGQPWLRQTSGDLESEFSLMVFRSR